MANPRTPPIFSFFPLPNLNLGKTEMGFEDSKNKFQIKYLDKNTEYKICTWWAQNYELSRWKNGLTFAL